MSEEDKDVAVEAETTEDSSPEETQPEEEAQANSTEETDESGVPLKNRLAEKERKLQKTAKELEEAQKALLQGNNAPQTPEMTEEEAIETVRKLAREENQKALEPILAKQFLMENPDAAEMIEDINKIRNDNPELAGVDKLALAYKIAKAERQDELIKRQVEQELKNKQVTNEKAEQASLEGTGKTRSTGSSLQDQIANAKSLEELQKLESLIVQ